MPMSQNIVHEVTFFYHSFLAGIVITLIYDGFLVVRRLYRHSLFLISLEDLFFWIGCAIGVFYLLYDENNGILRWFAILGAAMGMLLYKKTISPFLIKFTEKILQGLIRILCSVFAFLFRPVVFLSRKGKKLFKAALSKGAKIGKYTKNQLTQRQKILKITLCKQKENRRKEVRDSHGKKSRIS